LHLWQRSPGFLVGLFFFLPLLVCFGCPMVGANVGKLFPTGG
jgi:hypothetical protein